MQPWSGITEPGTIDDLVTDAVEAGHEATARLVHDWVAQGLLDKPTRRSKGRRGSAKALHATSQRKLFLLLLEKRQEMPKIPSLALIPLYLWLYFGDEYVPTRQALKAFRTWLKDGMRNKRVASEGARGMLQQLDHPLASDTARNRLLRLLTDVQYAGRFDREELAEAARAVFEPASAFGTTGLVRAAGHPEVAVTVEGFLTYTEAMCTAIRRVRDGGLDTALFDRVRLVYRRTKSDYLARRHEYAAEATGALAAAFAEPTLDDVVNDCGRELLSIVGFEILSAEGRLEHVV
ncbi:hypothetical protein [Streptomyces noursei]|uniref:hypothetical protein n=1 Tax=Streptomyces noursei TaxID=1971 RepID=UPI0030F3555F